MSGERLADSREQGHKHRLAAARECVALRTATLQMPLTRTLPEHAGVLPVVLLANHEASSWEVLRTGRHNPLLLFAPVPLCPPFFATQVLAICLSSSTFVTRLVYHSAMLSLGG